MSCAAMQKKSMSPVPGQLEIPNGYISLHQIVCKVYDKTEKSVSVESVNQVLLLLISHFELRFF